MAIPTMAAPTAQLLADRALGLLQLAAPATPDRLGEPCK